MAERKNPCSPDEAIDVTDAEIETGAPHSGNEGRVIGLAEPRGDIHIGREPRLAPDLHRLRAEYVPARAAL